MQGSWASCLSWLTRLSFPIPPIHWREGQTEGLSFHIAEITRGQLCSELHHLLILLTQLPSHIDRESEGSLPYHTDRATQPSPAQGVATEQGTQLWPKSRWSRATQQPGPGTGEMGRRCTGAAATMGAWTLN